MHQFPFSKILLPFILGILCCQYCAIYISFVSIIATLGIIAIALIMLAFSSSYFRFRFKILAAVFNFMFVFCAGYFIDNMRASIVHPIHYAKHFALDSSQQNCVVAIVQDAIIPKPKSYKTTITLQRNITTLSNVQGDALAYFTQCDSAPALQPGDKILLQASFLQIRNNGNIGEFDYKTYCNNKGITHQVFLKPNQYKLLAHHSFTWASYFANVKMHTINILRKHITNSDAFGIAQALLIGDKTEIDQDTWDAYSRTGIVHIIAISGMHMGIIYNCLLWLLLQIPFLKSRSTYPIIIALLAMWYFAFVTGMPASVMRAAIMFTFIGIGQAINRQGNSFNLLMASAFVLLSYNPAWLQDIGFLLSYAAVIGIMIFAKRINSLVYSKYYLVNQMWSLFSATIGAQIFTLPLCLYFFHQFPLLFLLSNLLAIPLTTIILFLEIGVLAFSFLPSVAQFLGGIASAIIIWLNHAISVLGTIKHFTIYDVQISYLQMWCLLLFAIFATSAWVYKHFKSCILALNSLIIFWVMQINYQRIAALQSKLVVYQINKQSVMDIISGAKAQAISFNNVTPNDVKNAITPTRTAFRCVADSNICYIKKDSNFNLIYFKGQSILNINAQALNVDNAISADVIILSNNTTTTLLNIKNNFTPKALIADGSNSLWKIEQWKTQALELNLPFYSTTLQGAFVQNM